jgi:hypothetical protein
MKIIINVSNYDHRRGGFWLPVKLGTFSDVQKQLANSWAVEWSVMSLLLRILTSLPVLFHYFTQGKDNGFFQHDNYLSGNKTTFYVPLSYSQPGQHGMDLGCQI